MKDANTNKCVNSTVARDTYVLRDVLSNETRRFKSVSYKPMYFNQTN
jgi:hypothetical protein